MFLHIMNHEQNQDGAVRFSVTTGSRPSVAHDGNESSGGDGGQIAGALQISQARRRQNPQSLQWYCDRGGVSEKESGRPR